MSKPKTHELWCAKDDFAELKSGHKTFDIRLDDHDFHVGDHILQKELTLCHECLGVGYTRDYTDRHRCCEPPHGKPTGCTLRFKITYVTEFSQADGYVVMALKPLKLFKRKCSSKKSKPKPSRR